MRGASALSSVFVDEVCETLPGGNGESGPQVEEASKVKQKGSPSRDGFFRQLGARNDDEDHRPARSRQSGRHGAFLHRADPDNLSAVINAFVF